MGYTLVVEYSPSETLRNIDKTETKSLKTFDYCRTLKDAMSSLMSINLREFSADIVLNESLPRHLISASIIDGNLKVIANLRILKGFEDINMPKAVYLQIDHSNISVEQFEQKADFPLSTYSAYGPLNNYYLLRMKSDLDIDAIKTIISKNFKSNRKLKDDKDIKKRI